MNLQHSDSFVQSGGGQSQIKFPYNLEYEFLSGSEFVKDISYEPSNKANDEISIKAQICLGQNIYLLAIDDNYHCPGCEQSEPIRIYPVEPDVHAFMSILRRRVSFKNDFDGHLYFSFPGDVKAIIAENLKNNKSCSEVFLNFVKIINEEYERRRLATSQNSDLQSNRATRGSRSLLGRMVSSFGSLFVDDDYRSRRNNNRHSYASPEYVDGRLSRGKQGNSRCLKVVLSKRALSQIMNESIARIETETGGLLLGHVDNGVWYVIESSEPGYRAVFTVAYHEADKDYQNHVCSVISRTYKYPLSFLGMWHRHPGSLDKFSGTDDITNGKYAVDTELKNGCVSVLINFDPNFRMTFYFAELCGDHMRYTLVDYECGDDKFGDLREILQPASPEEIYSRASRR